MKLVWYKLSITIIATGFEQIHQQEIAKFSGTGRVVHKLEEEKVVELTAETENEIELAFDKEAYEKKMAQKEADAMKLVTKKPEPVVATAENAEEDDELKDLKKSIEVKKRLRNLSLKLSTPRNVNEMEKEPAYKRRNVELTDAIPSDVKRMFICIIRQIEEETICNSCHD